MSQFALKNAQSAMNVLLKERKRNGEGAKGSQRPLWEAIQTNGLKIK